MLIGTDCEEARLNVVAAHDCLGMSGRLLTLSKSRYYVNHPRFVPNANVLVNFTKVWSGDLDLDRDEPDLQRLADVAGEVVHVLHEMDGRFNYEDHPRIERAVATFLPEKVEKVEKVENTCDSI